MTTAREIALEVLPHFAKNVLAGYVFSYGHYAAVTGRSAAKESMALGKAMHAIGAACVFAKIPVAPLYFVKRADNQDPQVFVSDPLENQCVIGYYDTLFVAAREYRYNEQDFRRIEVSLRETIPNWWSPHQMWHVAVAAKPKGSNETYFERALAVYKGIIENERQARKKSKP
jgi:hypothetical protein